MWPMTRTPGSSSLGCGKRARTQSPKPMRPGMRSMRAPISARSRAARSIIRFTAAASQVGLSHSIHGRSPASMASASKGRFVGFIGASQNLGQERLRAGIAGVGEEVLRRAVLDDDAAVGEVDVVGDL